MKKFLSKISLVAMALSLMPTLTAHAANDITLSVNSGSSANTYTVISWTAQAYAPPATITITADGGGLITATSTSVAGGTVSVSGSGTGSVVLTVTATTTAGAATYPISFAPNGTTPTNYTITLTTSSPVDVGAAYFYAYGGNLVTVTASVSSTLAFIIRNSADTANTNSCPLGALTTAASSTCSYRLRISTNAANGFMATIAANHSLQLTTGTSTIADVVDNTASSPGSEQYGIEVYGASSGGRVGLVYTGAILEENTAGYTFQQDTSPVPTSTKNFLSFNNAFDAGTAPNLTNTSLIKHFANITGVTPAGDYSQVVTYTVTSFF